MIITKKHLIEIEEFVGHDSEAGVLSGTEQGSIAIRVWAKKSDGHTFNSQVELTRADFMNDSWDFKFDKFKHDAKRDFDSALQSE